VLKFLSVNNIVIPPAKTGSDNNNKIAVIKTDQTNKGSLKNVNPEIRILTIVVIKFIAPNSEDIPAKCKLKIAKSTEPPECETTPLNGGYTVQPVPAPNSIKAEDINKVNDGGNNQKLILFNLGNAISGAPIITGTNKLPKPPIKTGITKKNIIKKACAVIKTLYTCQLESNKIEPVPDNSNLITTEITVPNNPEKPPKIKYNIPISL